MSADFLRLKVPGTAGDAGLTTQLRSNMQYFLDWALLNLGYYMNVSLDTYYPYGGVQPCRLRLSDDSRFKKGTVWDGIKTNWIWETGLDTSPINISGVYINNIFYPTGTAGTYAYNINYPLGRVIFNNPLPTQSIVKLEYSYKYYNIYPDTVGWFKQLTQGTWLTNDNQFQTYGSGLWSVFPESRTQLPAVVIEVSPRTRGTPKALGGGQWIWKDVLIHIFSENDFDRDALLDIMSYQKDKRWIMLDQNAVSRSGSFPLNQFGYLVNAGYNYPFLIYNYPWRDCIIRDINITTSENNPQGIYHGVATWSIQVDMPDIL